MARPQSQDYNEAIQIAASSFADPELRGGQAVTNAMGLPMPRSGNFADVYEFQGVTGTKWAIKCFTREVAGLQERYHEISKYLKQAALPFTVDFTYLPQGIRISGHWYPVLKMQWVEGLLLNEFVRHNLEKTARLEALARIWLRLARRLHAARLAHADLQHGNVILVPGSKAGSLAVKLIDYDGMFVPALAGANSGEVGHPAYQHPRRLEQRTYNAELDRFPLLAGACALRALVVGGKALWDRYDNGDNLLFREADLRRPGDSRLLKELWDLPDADVHDLTAQVALALMGPLEQVPLLQDLFVDGRLRPLQPAEEDRVTAWLGQGRGVKRPGLPVYTTGSPVAVARAGRVAPAVDPWESLADEDDAAVVIPRRRATGRSSTKVLAALFMLILCAVAGLGFWLTRQRQQPDETAHTPIKPNEPAKKKPQPPDNDTPSKEPAEPKPTPNALPKKQPGDVAASPRPVARWTFEKDGRDSIHGITATLHGGAIAENGRLLLNGGKAYMKTEPLPFDLGTRSLEVWLTLADLGQGDSAVMQIVDGRGWWDGLLYATRQARKWYPGSSFNQRSGALDGPEENAKPGDLVHLVLVSRADNSITLYRNGKVYGSTFTPAGPNSELQSYKKEDAFVVFGANGGSAQFFAGTIAEARLYDVALNEGEIAALYRAPPVRASAPKEVALDPAYWRGQYEGIWEVRYQDHDFVRKYVISPDGRAAFLGGAGKIVDGKLVRKGSQHLLQLDNNETSTLRISDGKLHENFFFPASEYPYQPTFAGTGARLHSFRGMAAEPDARFQALTGIWSLRYSNNTARLYHIDPKGKAASVDQKDFRAGSLIEKDQQVLLDLGDNSLERLKVSSGRLYVEHFNPGKYPGVPDSTAVGDRWPDDDLVRLPARKKSELTAINGLMLLKYKEEYARNDPRDRKSFAQRLLRDAPFVKGPRDRYAHLLEAMHQAAQGFDFPAAFAAIHELEKAYEVNPLNLKMSALTTGAAAARLTIDSAFRSRVAEACLAVVEDARNADAHGLAAKILGIAGEQAARTNNSALRSVVKQQSRLLDRCRLEYDKVKSFRERLKADPKDVEANLEVGKFVCFVKGNWDDGLPLLVASIDPALAPLARQDLDNPEDARTQAELAAAWSALAEKAKGQESLKARAGFWYRRALPGLSGGDRSRALDHLQLVSGGTTLVPGLVAEYFADEEFKSPAVKRIDYALNYHWGRASPGAGVPADHFSVRWQGYLVAPHAGVYQLIVSADDGCRLYIDGQKVHDAWKGGRHSASLPLTQGPHQLRIEHHEGTGGANMLFSWSLDGVFAEQPVPREALYHRRPASEP